MALKHARNETITKGRGRAYSKVPPFGWKRVGSDFVPDDAEQKILAEIHKMKPAPRLGKTWDEVADWLDANKIAPRGGGAWYAATAWQVAHSKLALESKEVA